MKFHPLAELFPLMQGPEFDEFVADVKANGLIDPIVVHENMILDGRNRFRACEAAGVAPRFLNFHGADPLSFVLSLNLHRRHLNETQRSIVAAKIATLRQGRPEESGQLAALTQAEAALMLNVGERSVRRAREVLDHGSPELVQAAERGLVSVSAAAEVAELPAPEQREVVARGEREIIETAKRLRQAKSAEVDARQAADLIVLRGRDMTIACRIRRHGYADRYPWDITIRSKRDSGARIELEKIVEGWADWFFYGHASRDPGALDRWVLLDLSLFRREFIREGLRQALGMQPRLGPVAKRQSNGDGTHFVAFDVRRFPRETVIASSHDVPMHGTEAA